MIGQDLVSEQHVKGKHGDNKILVASNLWAKNDRGMNALEDVSLTLYAGEIVGVAGVAGNGQRELAEVLTGLRPVEKGTINIQGEELSGKSSEHFVQAGVGHIPEDRLGTGLVAHETVTNNAILRENSNHLSAEVHGWIAMLQINLPTSSLKRQASAYQV